MSDLPIPRPIRITDAARDNLISYQESRPDVVARALELRERANAGDDLAEMTLYGVLEDMTDSQFSRYLEHTCQPDVVTRALELREHANAGDDLAKMTLHSALEVMTDSQFSSYLDRACPAKSDHVDNIY